MVLGETYDPASLARMGVLGIKGDAAKARDYYAKALAAGMGAARERMAAWKRRDPLRPTVRYPTPSRHDLARAFSLGHRLNRHARADLLQIADNDLIALGDAAGDRDEIAVGRAERNEALVDFVALADDIDIFAELARSERDLRRHQRIGLLLDMELNADILARQQMEIGVADRRARGDRAGRAIDHIVDERQFALVRRLRFAGQKNVRFDLARRPRLARVRRDRISLGLNVT